ncbi:MAG: hypothetical protein ACLFUC_07890 [Bacteroidales bacterium]
MDENSIFDSPIQANAKYYNAHLQVNLATNTGWEDRENIILWPGIRSIRYSALIGSHPDWLGKELKIRVVQHLGDILFVGEERRIMLMEKLDAEITNIVQPCNEIPPGFDIDLTKIPESDSLGEKYFLISIDKFTKSYTGYDDTVHYNNEVYYNYTNSTCNKNLPIGQNTLSVTNNFCDIDNFISTGVYRVNVKLFALNRDYFTLTKKLYFERKDFEVEASPTYDSDYTLITGETHGKITIKFVNYDPPFKYWTNHTTLSGEPSVNVPDTFQSNHKKIFADNMLEGKHVIYGQTSNGCVAKSEQVILQGPPLPEIIVDSVKNVSCNIKDKGEHDDGIIMFHEIGGIPPFFYTLYREGVSLDHINNASGAVKQFDVELTSGKYVISGSDCTGYQFISNTIVIKEPLSLSLDNIEKNMPSCYEFHDGMIKGVISGGNPNYNYSHDSINWSGSPAISNLSSGNYTYHVKDNQGCYNSFPVSLSQPSELNFLAGHNVKTTCETASNGEYGFKITGGTPYREGYDIFLNGKPINQRVRDTILTGLSSGYHTIKATDTNNCQVQKEIFIDVSENQMEILEDSVWVKNVSCAEVNNGKIRVKIKECEIPNPPYTFSIGIQGMERTVNNVSETFHDLGDDNYEISVTDKDGCNSSLPVKVDVIPNPVQAQVDKVLPARCTGSLTGVVSVTGSDGIPYSDGYQIALTGSGVDTTLANYGYSFNYHMLGSGHYSVTFEDADGCQATDSFEINENSSPVSIQQFGPVEHQACDEIQNGRISVNAAVLNNDSELSILNLNSNIVINNDTASFEYLKAGEYTIVAMDTFNCRDTFVITVDNLHIKPQTSLIDMFPQPCPGINKGHFQVKTNHVDFYKGLTYTLIHGTDSVVYSSNDSLYTFRDLNSGYYRIIVEEYHGCKGHIDINLSMNENQVKLSTPEIKPSTCMTSENGEVSIIGSGGYPFKEGYLYILSDYDSLTSNSGNFKGLNCEDIYQIKIIDSMGCHESSQAFKIPVDRNFLRIKSLNTIPTKCPGDSTGILQVKTLNGLPSTRGFNLRIFNHKKREILSRFVPDSFKLDNLKGGNYYLLIEDSVQCGVSDHFSISEPSPVSIDVTHGFIREKGGNDGSVTVKIKNGNPNYILEFLKANAPEDTLYSGYSDSLFFMDQLTAGIYLVKVKDENGCIYNGKEWTTELVSIHEPEEALKVRAERIFQPTCKGYDDGMIQLKGSGGWGDSYLFSIDSTIYSANSDFKNLKAGKYTFHVLDTSGVHGSQLIELPEPDSLTVIIDELSEPNCHGYSDGFAKLIISGGTPDYYISHDSINWIQGDSINDIRAGNNKLHVKDMHECFTSTDSFYITQPPPLLITDSVIIKSACGKANGAIAIEVSGGTPGYMYNWYGKNINISREARVDNISAGRYKAVVRDGKGCYLSRDFNVSDISDITLEVEWLDNVTCHGKRDGAAEIKLSGGYPPYKFYFDDKQSTTSLSGIPEGDHTCMVVDSAGCQLFQNINIGGPAKLQITPEIVEPYCLGIENGKIKLDVTGGTPPYNYYWNTGIRGREISSLPKGKYLIKVIDNHDCESTREIFLDYQHSLPVSLKDTFKLCEEHDLLVEAGDYSTYTWYDEDFRKLGEEDILPVSNQGKYYLEVTDEMNCEALDSFEIKIVDIDISPEFLAASVINLGDTLLLIETSIPFPDSVSWNFRAETYQTDFNAYSKMVIPRDTGELFVGLTAWLDGCGASTAKKILVKEILDENKKKSTIMNLVKKINLYPNPVSDYINVDVLLSETRSLHLRLVHMQTGREVRRIEFKGSNHYSFDMNLQDMMKGYYLFYFEIGDERFFEKILKHP